MMRLLLLIYLVCSGIYWSDHSHPIGQFLSAPSGLNPANSEGKTAVNEEIPEAPFGKGFGYDIRGQALEAPEELGARNKVTLTPQLANWIGKALGSRHRVGAYALVTSDHRESSEALREALIDGLLSVGIYVGTTDEYVPTGATSRGALAYGYALAVQITGSHNPWYANGFKITEKQNETGQPDPTGIPTALFGKKLLEVHEVIKTKSWRQLPEGSFTTSFSYPNRIVKEYIDALDHILPSLKKWRVVVDAGNGIGGPPLVALLKKRGAEVVELFTNPHPRFPHHPADPSKDDVTTDYSKSGVRYCSEKVRELNANLKPGEIPWVGIVIDGDGDRAGYLDEKGRPIPPERLLIALYHRFILENQPAIRKLNAIGHKVKLALDVRASGVVNQILKHYVGVEGVFIPAGYPSHRQFVRQQITEIRRITRGTGLKDDPNIQHLIKTYPSAEASGHYFYSTEPAHPDIKIDDGLYAAIFGLHILDTASVYEAHTNAISLPTRERYSLEEFFAAIPRLPVTTDIRDMVDESEKFGIVHEAGEWARGYFRDQLQPTDWIIEIDGLKTQSPEHGIIQVDGIRMQLKDGSWFLIRASNTSPMLTYKVEAPTQERLVELMEQVLQILQTFEHRGLDIKEFRNELQRQRRILDELDKVTTQAL